MRTYHDIHLSDRRVTERPLEGEAIDVQTSDFDGSIPIAVEALPKVCGREGLLALEKMFNPGVESNAHVAEKKSQSFK